LFRIGYLEMLVVVVNATITVTVVEPIFRNITFMVLCFLANMIFQLKDRTTREENKLAIKECNALKKKEKRNQRFK
jgi:hypothetical protein